MAYRLLKILKLYELVRLLHLTLRLQMLQPVLQVELHLIRWLALCNHLCLAFAPGPPDLAIFRHGVIIVRHIVAQLIKVGLLVLLQLLGPFAESPHSIDINSESLLFVV